MMLSKKLSLLEEFLGRGEAYFGEHTIAIKKIIGRIEKMHWTVCRAAPRLDCLLPADSSSGRARPSERLAYWQATCQTAESSMTATALPQQFRVSSSKASYKFEEAAGGGPDFPA
jgi:hypothetical protein